MMRDEQHIDPELLRRYYAKELSPAARHALEMRALEDPFLKSAMDGFDENPGSFEAFYVKHKKQLRPKRTYTVSIALGILMLLFITVVILNKKIETSPVIAINQSDSLIDKQPDLRIEQPEIEVLSPAVESMELIPKAEQISPKEVVKNQGEIATNELVKIKNERILVEDVVIPEDDSEPEQEEWNWYKRQKEAMPTAYLFDLKVVDYRQIKRDNDQISYKRYELGGVAADKESETSTNELIEKEVEIPYYTYLSKTMSFFDVSNFKPALNRFLVILEQYPEDLNALFYSGLAYYNLGKYEKSIDFFDKIMTLDPEVFNQEAAWYRAKSLIQLGKKKEAKTALEEIIMKGGFYTPDAIELAAKLK